MRFMKLSLVSTRNEVDLENVVVVLAERSKGV
jgi:hypothetical protein